MRNTYFYLFIFIIALSVSENLFSSGKPKNIASTVSGKVLDEKNFPVPNAKVTVSGKEVQTDLSGKFIIPNVSFPYDAVIADRLTSTAVIYKNLSIDNPDLILFVKQNPRNINSAVINVTFPEIPDGSSAVIKFISKDIFYCEDTEIYSREKNKTLTVYWPIVKKELKGEVIFVQRNETKYEVFKKISSVLRNNSAPFEVEFKKDSFNIRTSDITIYLPYKDYKLKGYYVNADFFDFDRNSKLMLAKHEENIFRTKCIVPYELPFSYLLKVSGFVDYSDGSGFVNSVYSKPGDVVNLETEIPPELQTPSDKYLGASGNTEFYYSLGSGTGIYVVHFQSINPGLSFYIVTGERSVYLNYLSREEIKRAGSIEFKWNVEKHLTYFSVNDFVKPKIFRNDPGYKAVLYSSERTFKTGYF